MKSAKHRHQSPGLKESYNNSGPGHKTQITTAVLSSDRNLKKNLELKSNLSESLQENCELIQDSNPTKSDKTHVLIT